MKKIYYIIYSFAITLILGSCNLKESKLKKQFNDKVWIIDSIKVLGSATSITPLSGYILKATKDSVFEVYKDDELQFESFKIKNDTLFLKNDKIFKPYKLEEIDENSIKLTSLLQNEYNQIICLTNLTDLFQEKPIQNSKIYDVFKDNTWYPIKVNRITFGNEVLLDDSKPDYYLKKNALRINGNRSFYNNSSLLSDNSICKFTNKCIYVFDKKTKTITSSLRFSKKESNKITLKDYIGFKNFEFKKIDPSILIDEKDLPIEVRLNCNQYTAEDEFNLFISQKNSSDFIYDGSSISFNKISECEYDFSIIRRSRSFHDIYRTIYYKLIFLEGFKIRITPVN